MLQVSPEADFDSPCGSSSARAHNLVLLLFDFLVKIVNFSLHHGTIFFHLHYGHLLLLDILRILALFPQVKGLALSLLQSTDNHVLQVLANADVLLAKDFLPVEEVACHVGVNVPLGAVKTSALARSHGRVSLLLNLLVEFFHSGLTVTFEGLLHEHELFFFFVLSQSIEAALQQP